MPGAVQAASGQNGGGQTSGQPTAKQLNMLARQVVLQQALNMWQPIFTNTYTTGPGTVINIPPRMVGLVKRFKIEVQFTVAQGAAETQTQTKLGIANFFSSIVFSDLANQQRIQTTGWHLHMLATARRQMAYLAAYVNDSPINIGSNYSVIKAPASVTTAQSGSMFYEIPISYSDYDLRGAIFANVVNATMNLQLTVNPAFFCTSTADSTLSVYKSSTAQLGVLSTFTITVHQNYLDQIPQTQTGPVLPVLDLSTSYLLNNTIGLNSISANQDNTIPYANFREFMSTFLLFDNGGTLNAGTDVNYWAIQSANYTNILKYDAYMSSALTREYIGDDYPTGMYYFDHRQKPIVTNQYGNMQIVLNPSAVNAGANVQVGYEQLAYVSVVTQSGSLYSG